ncbi:L-fucose:H+ symporter permease [Loigolactobacillus bifermentans]|uniref:Fucose transport protein n=1 Tax=Loigolactobacillus bifermentans DSM 20003 TaxID=1423726 RepID=A0A0R1H3C5_9LACO|nr:fucose transport protein [Loigolactobacillus bifermentans DSM 20003]QGG61180.1 L-fucose:H+ symporter permease [Loigolactobacillus bifermentans]
MEKPAKSGFHLFKLGAKELDDGYLDRTPMFQYILLSLLFPMWGMAASLNDILITQFKTIFTLSNVASAFVQTAFYLGYFLIAIPASLIIKKTSYKLAIMIGLTLYTIGSSIFFPASRMATYGFFLVALFALACGLSFLETSANTFSSLMGPKKFSTLRLNISQTFYPIGAMSGILMGKYLIFGSGASLEKQMAGMNGAERIAFGENALQHTLLPYKYIIMVLLVALVIFGLTQFPSGKPKVDLTKKQPQAKISETVAYLAHNKKFLQGIFTEFMYVGMQTAVWSFTIRLAMDLNHNINERSASTFMIFSYAAFFIGKMIANFMMKRFTPSRVLQIFSVFGIIALLYIMFVHNMTAVYSTILVSGLFGPCWATIYSQTLDTVTDKRHTETAGAIIVMSIIGGAFIPLAQGFVADISTMSMSFVVNVVCFAVVAIYATFKLREPKASH